MADQPFDTSELRPEKFLSAGCRGEVMFLCFLVALMAAIALLIVASTDTEASRALPLMFYIGGGVVVICGFLSALEKVPYWYPTTTREAAFTVWYVYAALGVALTVVGAVLDA